MSGDFSERWPPDLLKNDRLTDPSQFDRVRAEDDDEGKEEE